MGNIHYGFKSFLWKGTGDAALTSLGLVAADPNPKFSTAPPEIANFFAAHNPQIPAISIPQGSSSAGMDIVLMEADFAQLKRIFGGIISGTAPNDSWAAPVTYNIAYGSFECVTETGLKISAPKAMLTGSFDAALTRKELVKVPLKLSIMLPDDNSSPYSLSHTV